MDKAINEVVDEIDEGEDDEEVEPRKAKIIVPKSKLAVVMESVHMDMSLVGMKDHIQNVLNV